MLTTASNADTTATAAAAARRVLCIDIETLDDDQLTQRLSDAAGRVKKVRPT